MKYPTKKVQIDSKLMIIRFYLYINKHYSNLSVNFALFNRPELFNELNYENAYLNRKYKDMNFIKGCGL
jgi:hypothetical protein